MTTAHGLRQDQGTPKYEHGQSGMNLCLAFFLGMGGEMNEIKIYKNTHGLMYILSIRTNTGREFHTQSSSAPSDLQMHTGSFTFSWWNSGGDKNVL